MSKNLFTLLFVILIAPYSNAQVTDTTDTDSYVEVEKYTDNPDGNLKANAKDILSSNFSIKFSNISAKDKSLLSTIHIVPSTNYEVGINYSRYLSEKFSMIFGLGANYFSISNNTNITPNIESQTNSQAILNLGVNFKSSEDSQLILTALYKPQYYLLLMTSGNLNLKTSPNTTLQLESINNFYKTASTSLAVSLIANYINNTETDKNGYAFGGGLSYRESFQSNDSVSVKLDYLQTTLESPLYNLVDQNMVLSLSYSLPY